ncbi:MAG: ABC transporter permease [Rhizobiaceae bacterium]|nr:ABC transporter permease [Rhizobiaceae bacterium]
MKPSVWLPPLLVTALFLVCWEIFGHLPMGRVKVVPPVSAIAMDIIHNHQLLLRAMLHTLTEAMVGFAAGAAFGFLMGVLFAEVRILERMFFPVFIISQTIPVVAFGALVVIWFGNGMLSKVVIAFYLTFFPVTVHTHRGLLSVEQQRIDLLRSFAASRWTLFWRLRLPFALPTIMTSLILGSSLSLVGAIVGEWFGDTKGLGIMLVQAMYVENMVRLWSIIVACGVIGVGLYAVLRFVQTRWIWWGNET